MPEQPFADIAPWPPTRWTEPLSEDFPSAFDGYRDLFRLIWMAAFGYTLELWQEIALRHVFELYPEGHDKAGQLRFRQIVISLGRQNGKTEIAAAIGLMVLIMKAVPIIVGLASNADQARLVYNRTMTAIRGTPRLARKFKALTDTRGIRTLDGGSYEIKAAKSAALQGIPLDAGLVDELHIIARKLWFDLVNGLGGRPNCFIAGITTAGDEGSELLIHLYTEGEKAIEEGDATRMCFLVWEAPESRRPADDETLARWLCMANPSLASGRVDVWTVVGDVRSMPEPDAVRYRLNRFIASANTFIPVEAWTRGTTTDPFPAGVQPVFVFSRTSDWGYASVTAFAKRPDGTTYCDLVASIAKPTISQLADIATRLTRYNPQTFGMGNMLRDLKAELDMRGLPTTMMTSGDFMNGSALFYSKVTQGLVLHPGHQLLSLQIPRTIRKNVGENFRISWEQSSIEIDAVVGHVIGIYLAETQKPVALQIF